MRPFVISPLFATVSGLQMVGPKTSERFHKIGVERVWDLLQLFPPKIEERRFIETLEAALLNEKVTMCVQVVSHSSARFRQNRHTVSCFVDDQPVDLIFFHTYATHLQGKMPPGAMRLVSGTLEKRGATYQVVHPDFMGDVAQKEMWLGVRPLYGLTAGVSQTQYGKVVRQALDRLPDLPEWIPAPLLKEMGWHTWKVALQHVHTPQAEQDLLPNQKDRARLAFDELFAHQLSLHKLRTEVIRHTGKKFGPSKKWGPQVVAQLGFQLTAGQQDILHLLENELNDQKPMMRLLQGDVGSGKTVVALLSLLQVIEQGGQGAFLAPTEILAEQHGTRFEQFLEGVPVRWAVLTGKTSAKEKKQIKEKLSEGTLDLVIGTHALLETDVVFKNLGYVVIDEQHRFGVNQRKKLIEKGEGVNLLVMSATPIPRSLALTSFGDLDICQLREKPKGRTDIKTTLLSLGRIQELYDHLQTALKTGQKFYWVCPLIEESEALDLGHAEARVEALKALLGDDVVGLLHGRMKADEKEEVMRQFVAGTFRVLVSTTVIEVGVDVPDATVMIVEHAERFGLAQLHQLRGRVGRGTHPSSCVLLYGKTLSETGKKRLEMMRQTNDGFLIAEADMKLRGPGDVLGTKQSGVPDFKMADLEVHGDLLAAAHNWAKKIDPQMVQSEPFQILLGLFPYLSQMHMKS